MLCKEIALTSSLGCLHIASARVCVWPLSHCSRWRQWRPSYSRQRARAHTQTQTHTHSNTLSLRRCVLSGVSPTRCYRAWNSPIISGGLTHAKTPPHLRPRARAHARTSVSGNTVSAADRLDYTSGEAQPDRGTSTQKRKHEKEYKRLILPVLYKRVSSSHSRLPSPTQVRSNS